MTSVTVPTWLTWIAMGDSHIFVILFFNKIEGKYKRGELNLKCPTG
jgi:hypothetical protein